MNAPAVLRDALSCPSCAGHMAFSPGRQALVCAHCGGETAIASTAEDAHDEVCLTVAGAEAPYDADGTAVAAACESCAGEILFTGPALSTRCPYCDGPVVRRGGATGFAPAGLAPFRVVEAEARAAVARWFRTRRLLPAALKGRADDARLAGVYAPFWTFDSRIVVDYVGHRGRKSGKNTVWTRVEGRIDVPFDDILVPASNHITADIRDATGPWPVTRLVDFEPRFLAGFAAELHRVPAKEAAAVAREDVRPILEESVKHAIGGSRQRIERLEAEMTGTTCRSMLLPLWILHYEHRGTKHRVIASGVSGRAFGERPFCPFKVKAAAFAATVAAAVAGALVGLAHAGVAV